ncbi:MAG TPA: DEAD/DEAH box helicase [Thermoleophilia bacterium]
MFDNLGLDAHMLKAVRDMGYTEPTPIQEQAIPLALEGKDLVACAQTGTGKTAAFILPSLQRLNERDVTATGPGREPNGGRTSPGQPAKRQIRALVITPTRELALQIDEVARAVARTTGQRATAVHGGVGYGPQLAQLRRGVDLLVATPGRLLDLQLRGDLDLSHVEILVLDEADRMLDMGFWPDVRRIVNSLPTKRQNLLFSATMTPTVLRVIGATLTNPVTINVAPSATPVDEVEQAVYPVHQEQKTDLLVELLNKRDLNRVLVFTRTKHRADRLCRVLERSRIRGAAIHSNRSQPQRQQALDGFKRGDYRVLVATDIVARGIDVDRISHVINFDLPSKAEDYVHRIGRTARAGAGGTAISFMAAEEINSLRDIERLIGTVIPCHDLEGFDYVQRVVPSPERTAKRTPPRLVYAGSKKAASRRYSRSR